jgi:amino acid transporter
MSGQGKFKKQLSLIDLTFIGLGAIFGSGWLFAASHVSAIAGPAGIFSWLLGGFAVLLLGIVYCELGAALPVPAAWCATRCTPTARCSAT